MKPDIYQVELIGSGSLSVMAKPVSGEWMDDEFSSMRAWGIDRIVSLLERGEARELGLAEECEFANKPDREFVSFPIVDRGLPASKKDYLIFTKRMNFDLRNRIQEAMLLDAMVECMLAMPLRKNVCEQNWKKHDDIHQIRT